MGVAFKHLTEQISAKYANVKMLATEKVLLLKTQFNIIDKVTENVDYMFVIPSSPLSPTLIDKMECHFSKQRFIVFEPDSGAMTKINAPVQEYRNLAFNKEYFEDIVWKVTGKREVKFKELKTNPSIQLQQLIDRFEDEMVNYNGECSLMIQSICVQMIIELLRCTSFETIEGSKKSVQHNNHVDKAIEYMRMYFNAGITINDISQEINLSPYYFIRLFKAQTGKTPHEFLRDIRLERAKALLERSVNSVEETARLCGFVHPGHFSSFFRSNIGMTPSEYRQKHKAGIFK